MDTAPAVDGLHHLTAIAGDARRNVAFYRDTLGLRLVKRTVNFDDPGTYHLYFGDRTGTPGTAHTTFPWGNLPSGRRGTAEVGATAFTIPADSLAAWRDRLRTRGATVREDGSRFGEAVLSVSDDSGGAVDLIASDHALAGVQPWTGNGISEALAIRGLHTPTLVVRRAGPTQWVLETLLGFRPLGSEGPRHRFGAGPAGPGRQVDVLEASELPARPGAGSIHHIAFRVPTDSIQLALQRKLEAAGLGVSAVRDRSYFRSIYFREPGGILFEVATDGPGFAVDEPESSLGEALRLPPQYEKLRAEIERRLPPLD